MKKGPEVPTLVLLQSQLQRAAHVLKRGNADDQDENARADGGSVASGIAKSGSYLGRNGSKRGASSQSGASNEKGLELFHGESP